MGVVNNYSGLLATRLFLGVAGMLRDSLPSNVCSITANTNLSLQQ
jgi:hypothetical protein